MPTPVAIRLDRLARRLVIEWSDGVRSSFPWEYLRGHCPSAGESNARDSSDPLAVLNKIPNADLVQVRLVGNYAINLGWGDGHNVGIYTWEYLRQLSENSAVENSAFA